MILFAVDVDPIAGAGLLGGIVTLAVSVGYGIKWFLTWYAGRLDADGNDRKNKRRDAITELQDSLERKDLQLDRQQAQINEQQNAINRLRELYDDCRSDAGELWAVLVLLHGVATQLQEIAVRAGASMSGVVIPPLPVKPMRGREGEAEYIQRSTQFNTQLVDPKSPGNLPIPPVTPGGAK